ncbi:hypothetical protein LEN26_014878 [Aphanomyces euteiches]|nr:hypothetical protein LEN26_014878 [Aphanomyces euteiches]
MEEAASPSQPTTPIGNERIAFSERQFAASSSPSASQHSFTSPAAEYLIQQQVNQQLQIMQQQFAQQQQSQADKIRKIHEGYQKALADLEARSRAQEIAAKLSADIEHQRADEVEQQLRRTAAERDTIELTRQRERSSSDARTHEAEVRATAAMSENERYMLEIQRLMTQMAMDAEIIRAREAEIQRARLEPPGCANSRTTFSTNMPFTPSNTSDHRTIKPPNLTKFKMDKFSAKEAYQGFGADFDTWLERFYDKIQMESASNQTTWSKDHKYMALKKSLDDDARSFVLTQEKSWKASVPSGEIYSFDHLVHHLRQAYCTHLDTDQLMTKMKIEKRHAHTWNQHVQYLRHIQQQIGAPNKLVLEMFTKYACPEFKNCLIAGVDRNNKNNPKELDKAVETLVQLTGTGVNYGRKGKTQTSGNANLATGTASNNGGRGNRFNNNKPNGGRGRGGGRSGKHNGRDQTKRPCFACGQDGHFTSQCPLVIEVKNRRIASAAVASQNQVPTPSATLAASQTQPQTQARSGFGGFVIAEDEWQPSWTSGSHQATGNFVVGHANHTNQLAPQIQQWILDSGYSHHLVTSSTFLQNAQPSTLQIRVANNQTANAELVGSVRVDLNDTGHYIVLKEVHYVPGLTTNLISVATLNENGLAVSFTNGNAIITHGDQIVTTARKKNNLWLLQCTATVGDESIQNSLANACLV